LATHPWQCGISTLATGACGAQHHGPQDLNHPKKGVLQFDHASFQAYATLALEARDLHAGL
jgi:hypothetical protein